MIRISLIVALLAGLLVAGLNFTMVREKVTTLKSQRDTEHTGRISAESERDLAHNDLEKAKVNLKQTQENLASVTTERDSAVKEAAVQTQKATELATALETTTLERNTARDDLFRYTVSGLAPERLANLAKELKQLQDTIEVADLEKKILQRAYQRATNELARYVIHEYHGPPLRADLKGKIVVADPKWDFVVLNVGEDQGVQTWGELLVNRNGKLIAKVRVSTVEKARSIANVMPGWALADVMEGDEVIPAYPAS
jgi:hypothetical protein